jgi:eukaryotic-like serine/threonine-protein kinase
VDREEGMPGQTLAGRYRLKRLLGRGGMGSVWAADHVGLHAEVAVKLMKRSLALDAQAAARLKGAHTVAVHDVGTDDGMPFLVMELLEGEDLGVRLKRVPVIPPDAAAWVIDQVSRALHKAHAAGIVHRDLKPSNIFLARSDEGEVLKILDFGVAKIIGKDLGIESTNTTAMIGSPAYMSPEQIRSARDVDARSDLWSLGVIAYRILTGRLPFEGATAGDLLVKSCTEPAPPASAIQRSLDPRWDELFGVALAKDPARRFPTARAFAEAFTSVAAGRIPPPISATIDGPWSTIVSPAAWRALAPRSLSDESKIRALQVDAETLIRDSPLEESTSNAKDPSSSGARPISTSNPTHPSSASSPSPWTSGPTHVEATVPIGVRLAPAAGGRTLPMILIALACFLIVIGVLLVRTILSREVIVAAPSPGPVAPREEPAGVADPALIATGAAPASAIAIDEVPIESLEDAKPSLPVASSSAKAFPSKAAVTATSAAPPITTATTRPRMDLGLD